MAKNENDISIKRIIQNAFFMIRYAARYDKPLITRIMVLFILSKAGKAINDTFILQMIINGLTGKAEFSSMIVLLSLFDTILNQGVCHCNPMKKAKTFFRNIHFF